MTTDEEKLEHLAKARQELVKALNPVGDRDTYLDGAIGAVIAVILSSEEMVAHGLGREPNYEW